MGFLDNFKAAMQRGVDAANANIERQRAEQAAAAGAARPQPQAKPQPRTGHKLPEGVVMASLDDQFKRTGSDHACARCFSGKTDGNLYFRYRRAEDGDQAYRA